MGGGNHDGRRRARAWIALLAWTGLVLWLGGASFGFHETRGPLERLLLALGLPEAMLAPSQVAVRKGAHVAEYAVLGLLAHGAVASASRRHAGVGALTIALAVATLDEGRQLTLAGRTGAATDVALDLAGAGAGLWLARARLARRRDDRRGDDVRHGERPA